MLLSQRSSKSQWFFTTKIIYSIYTTHLSTVGWLRLCSEPSLPNLRAQDDSMCMLSNFSHVWLFATLWTVARQAPLSVEFSRQEYWSWFPCPPPRDLPDPGIELASLMSLALQAGSLLLAPPGKPLRMTEQPLLRTSPFAIVEGENVEKHSIC